MCKSSGATFIESKNSKAGLSSCPQSASQLPPPRSGIHDKREDEVVFRAHASRFALFSNPKVLKRSRSINPFLCWHFFPTRAFQSGLFPQPYNFPANTKEGGLEIHFNGFRKL